MMEQNITKVNMNHNGTRSYQFQLLTTLLTRRVIASSYTVFTVTTYTLCYRMSWLTLLLRIREVMGSNLGPKTGYPDYVWCGFPQSFQANSGILAQIRPRPLPSTSFTIHHSRIILPFDSSLSFHPEGGVGLVPKRGCLLTLAYYAFPR
jgi:hypothetical protein